MTTPVQRPPAEVRYADELARLAQRDARLGRRAPDGWRLSAPAVVEFVLGDGEEISAKFVGARSLVERCVVALATNRGLMLIGEPGTAKSLLSELLAAAISGDTTLTIQGSAATTEDAIKYSWNYALLLAEGPTARALVPAPVHRGMSEGKVVRFEELSRCAPEVQDALLSILSERVLSIPEFDGDARSVHALRGFNVIATANSRDRGVNEMSAALKRRFNGLGKDEARPGLDILTTRLRGPGAVQVFARLLGGRHASTALEWLNAHRGLVYAATLSARDAAPLALVLRAAPVEELRAHVGHTTEGVRAVIDEILAEQDLAPFDPATPWWAQAAQGITVARLPKGLVETLPPVVVEEGFRLADAEAQVLLTALMTADRDHPLLVAFRDQVPATVRDRFTIALLDTWLARGAAGKEQWLMVGSGCIAGDGFVHHLTPMVREWPGVAQHQRAVQGLAALRNVGSDVALQAIAGVASKVKFAAIKKRAGEEMEQIASTLGLTRPQLEDRIIPDGGLDERGTREFSFGARRFLASVTPEGKVIVRPLGADGRPTGKPRTALPAPNQSDDPRQAAEAKDELKVLKKTVADIAKIQRLRFEQAMVAGRRWSADEFQQYLRPHPLLRGLLKSVIWGVLEGETRVALGRLDEDGALVDVDDAPIDVTGRSVCIVHPVDLADDEIARWSEVQADYELVEAFPQLSRQRFALPAEQGDDLCLAGVPSAGIDPGRLVGACTKHGWQRGAALDAGVYRLFGQYFVAGDVTAVIQFEEGLWMGPMSEQDEQTLSAVYLLRGEFDPQNLDHGADPRFASPTFLGPIEHVPWSQAPRAVVSEVLATINAIAG